MKEEQFEVGKVIWHKHHNAFVTVTKKPYMLRNIGMCVDVKYEDGKEHKLIIIDAFSEKLVIPAKYKEMVEFV